MYGEKIECPDDELLDCSTNPFPSFGTASSNPIERPGTNPHLSRGLLPVEALAKQPYEMQHYARTDPCFTSR